MSDFSTTLSDMWVMIKRNLIRYQRLPQLIVFSSIQPVMFLLLFVYVFGGAISTSARSYVNYLLPGIFVQTVLFGSMQTGVGLADDLSKGLIDRFKSLPMARSAFLVGRTVTEILRNIFVLAIMTVVGLIIGFRIEHGIVNFLYAIGLTLIFGFAFSWISASIGMWVKNVETAQTAGFIWVFPLVFASSIFVPLQTLKSGVKVFAEHNPITYVVNTVRALILGTPVGHNAEYALIWTLGILIVFLPIAVAQYRRS
jgi:ABC transporter DrrB family efflux protein